MQFFQLCVLDFSFFFFEKANGSTLKLNGNQSNVSYCVFLKR